MKTADDDDLDTHGDVSCATLKYTEDIVFVDGVRGSSAN